MSKFIEKILTDTNAREEGSLDKIALSDIGFEPWQS